MRTSTNRIRKLVCLVIAFVISIFPVPLTSLALEEDVSYYSVQDNLSYEIVTRITSSWDKHQNIEMTFVNTGYEVIHNWYILYRREEGGRINYYSGDVHTGYLYCTEDSKEGVIAFTYSVLKSLDSWGHTFDPVLEASNLI